MTKALSSSTTLRFVSEVHEDENGAVLRFEQGDTGRLSLNDVKYSIYLRMARRSLERQHPLGATLSDGQMILELFRADNDVPNQMWEEVHGHTCLLFQGHDGVFHLESDHPGFERLRAELNAAIRQKASVWFVVQKSSLTLFDVAPVGRS